MKQNNDLDRAVSKEVRTPVYFSMNMPNWFMGKSVSDKCEIVEDLAEQLKDEKAISSQQMENLLPVQ